MSDPSPKDLVQDLVLEKSKVYKVLTNFPNYQKMDNPDLKPPTTSTKGRMLLQTWLGRIMRLKISDGRILIGFFACTDREVNLVLTKCKSYWVEGEDGDLLGTVMVPRKHIVSISIDTSVP